MNIYTLSTFCEIRETTNTAEKTITRDEATRKDLGERSSDKIIFPMISAYYYATCAAAGNLIKIGAGLYSRISRLILTFLPIAT